MSPQRPGYDTYDLIFWPVTIPKLSQHYPKNMSRKAGRRRQEGAGRQAGRSRQAGRQAGRNDSRQQGREVLRTSVALAGGGVYAGSMWDL